jgi:murein DD-endopeptidase MepM/ murein hydrolase activator NlpD
VLDWSRKIAVIIAPHGSPRSWNRDVSTLTLVLVATAAAAIPIVLLVLLIQVLDLSARAHEADALRAENSALADQGRRLRELEGQLAELQEFETRIRRWAGIEFADALVTEQAERDRHRWEREETLMAELPALSPVRGWVSRSFEAGADGHLGIDLVGETGTPILAAGLGVIRFAAWDDTFGNLVIIDHGNGFTSLYGHNDSLLVERGALVTRGTHIATLGNTGESTAPHLHFEARLEEEPLDPAFLLSPAG